MLRKQWYLLFHWIHGDKFKKITHNTSLFQKKNNKKKDVLWTSSDFGDFGDFLRVHLLSIG